MIQKPSNNLKTNFYIMNKFEEAVYIILEYCINKQIAINNIFQYLDLDQSSIYIVNEGEQQHLIRYFHSFQELNNLCRIMAIDNIDLQSKQKDPQNKNEHLFKKSKLYFKLRHLLKLYSGTQLDLSFWVNQYTNYYVQQLNQIANQGTPFPEILYSLSVVIHNNEIKFTIEPNKILRKSLKEALSKIEKNFKIPYVYMPCDEIKILETIIKNIKQNYSLKISKDNTVLNFLDHLQHFKTHNYKNNHLLTLLMKLKNRIIRTQHQFTRQPQQKNKFIIMIYLKEYILLEKPFPQIMKYVQIQRHSYTNQRKLEITGNQQFIQELQTAPEQSINNLNQINWEEISYEDLRKQYPSFENLKQQEIVIDSILKLSLKKAESIKELLITLFSNSKVILLLQAIQQLQLENMEIYKIIIKLFEYVEGITIADPLLQTITKNMNQKPIIENGQLFTNLRMLLRMMVDQNIIVPELIQFIKVYYNKNSLHQFCMIKSQKCLDYLENEPKIISLMDYYKVAVLEGKYRLLNFLPKHIKLQNKFYEFQCILDRLEEINKNKIFFRQQLIKIFQQETVKLLLCKLLSVTSIYKEEKQPYAHKGYQLLMNIKQYVDQDSN